MKTLDRMRDISSDNPVRIRFEVPSEASKGVRRVRSRSVSARRVPFREITAPVIQPP